MKSSTYRGFQPNQENINVMTVSQSQKLVAYYSAFFYVLFKEYLVQINMLIIKIPISGKYSCFKFFTTIIKLIWNDLQEQDYFCSTGIVNHKYNNVNWNKHNLIFQIVTYRVLVFCIY